MSERPKLFVKVCARCGRQVDPSVDHNLGASRYVYCSHGKGGVGTMETVPWKRIEVVPVEPSQPDPPAKRPVGKKREVRVP